MDPKTHRSAFSYLLCGTLYSKTYATWQQNKHSIHTMLDELSQLSCTNVGSNLWVFDQTSDVIDDMFELIGKETLGKWMTTAQIKALFNKSIKPAMFV